MTVGEYHSNLLATMRCFPDEIDGLAPDYVATNLAVPLANAVDTSFGEAAQVPLDELFRTLHQLDGDLEVLNRMSGQVDSGRGLFEHWAKYWTSVSPAVEVVRALVREVLSPKLPRIRERLTTFRTSLLVRSYVSSRSAKLRIGLPSFRANPTAHFAKRALLAVWRFLNLGFTRAKFEATVNGKDFVGCLKKVKVYREFQGRASVRRTRLLCFETDLLVEFEKFTLDDPLIEDVDKEASHHVPNSSFTGIGANYASTLRQNLEKQIEAAVPQIEASIDCVSNGWISLSSRLTWLMINAAACVTSIITTCSMHNVTMWFRAAIGVGLWLTLDCILALYSQGKLKTEIAESLLDAGQAKLEEASSLYAAEVANRVNDRLLDEVLKKVQVQLSPRPLQRALTKSLK